MKNNFQKLVIGIIITTSLLVGGIAFAENNITVQLDGKTLNFDVQPQIIGGRTMVPLRTIFEALGATVDWNNDTKTVTAFNELYYVQATINDNNMKVNGETKILDIPPLLVNGRTFVPARFIAEAFGAKVDWDDRNKKVVITTNDATPTISVGENVYKVSPGRDISGFDIKTNQTIKWYGIDFSFPAYFDVLKEVSKEEWITYYPEEEDYYANLMFQTYEFSETEEFFKIGIPFIVESTFSDGPFTNAEIQKSEEILIAGLPGWTITFTTADTDRQGVFTNGVYSFVYNTNAKKIIMISCFYDSNDQSQYDYLGDHKKVLETAKLSTESGDLNEIKSTKTAETLDLNAINNTNSAKSDAKFVGKYYKVTGIVYEAIGPSDGFNALVIIHPNVLAKGMGSTPNFPLEINIWMSESEFKKIGGRASIGKKIDVSMKLTSIGRNATSKDPVIKGYPIDLEFGEYD